MSSRDYAARVRLLVHSSPAALCPHLEWAIGGALGRPTVLAWSQQPLEPQTRKAELEFDAKPGTAARLASTFASFGRIRFEITQEPSPGNDGQRFAYTPRLGAFCAIIGVHGDVLVGEEQLRAAARQHAAGVQDLSEALDRLTGLAWDEELEAFRRAEEAPAVVQLHRVV